jgi:hypothetical protein
MGAGYTLPGKEDQNNRRTEAFLFITLSCLKLNFALINVTVHVQKINTCTGIQDKEPIKH